MVGPAPRLVFCAALALLTAVLLPAAEANPRAAPTRPGATPKAVEKPTATPMTKPPVAKARAAPPVSRPAKIETVRLDDVAARLGLKASTDASGRKFVLTDRVRRLELEADSREVRIGGLRVFLGHAVAMRKNGLHVSKVDVDTCLVPLLKPALLQRIPTEPQVIALDPGHGGVDQGTQNARLGLKEKTFTLDVSLRLKKLLEARGYKVVLTRDKDERLDLQSRAIIANRAGADLFVSVHFNALPADQKTRGTEVFTFAPQHVRSTNAWGGLQSDDTETAPAPANRHDAASSMLAHALHRELLGQLGTFDRGKKIGHLGALRGLNCPGVLVESGFLSNDEEAKKIATPSYRQQIAVALAAGIEDYASQVRVLGAKR